MSQKIILKLTPAAWQIVDEFLQQNNISSVQAYINTRLRRALNQTKDPDLLICNCDKQGRNFLIPEDICEELIQISERRCIPLSKIVHRNFIDPILFQYSKENGILL